MQTFIIFIVGVLAGFISGMIGGGSGLILVPIQLLLVIDPNIATTTTHFGFIGVSLGSLFRFNKANVIKINYIIPFILISILSGLLGPYVQFSIDSNNFQKIIAIIILFCVPLFIFKKNAGSISRESSLSKHIIGYIFLIIIFTLQVAFGAATGIMAIFSIVYFLGFSMSETNSILRFPNLTSSLIAVVIYSIHGKVNYEYGITLLVAMFAGGYIGSHIAIKSGEKFVKYGFSIFAVILSIILLFK